MCTATLCIQKSLFPSGLVSCDTRVSLLSSTAQLGKQPILPADVLDQITSMQKAIDSLSAEMSSVSKI